MKIALVSAGLLGGNAVHAGAQPTHNPFRKPTSLQLERNLASPVARLPEQALPDVRATLVGGAAPLALIGAAVVAIGQEVNGYRLVAVSEGAAVFERDGVTREVKVRRDATPPDESPQDDEQDERHER